MEILVIILSLLCILSAGVQCYLLRYRSLKRLPQPVQEPKSDKPLPKISVIICAKNEALHLKKNLRFILEQKYPDELWEVIVVNDASTDDTAKALMELQPDSPNLKVIHIEAMEQRLFPGKKYALDKGIKAAKFDYVLLTDADCRPKSNQWIQSFGEAFLNQKKSIILGYGAYERRAGFLNQLIQWETLATCMQYSGLALSGLPYMGVGRNLFYDKKLYQNALTEADFRKMYQQLPSGDDDLLISKIAQFDNIGLCLKPEATTLSDAPKNYVDWMKQKQRHVSTGKFYDKKIKRILGLSGLSQGIFWLTWIILVFLVILNKETTSLLIIALLLGIIRIGLYWNNGVKWYQLLKASKFIPNYPIGEICLSILQLILTPYIFWKNKQQWK